MPKHLNSFISALSLLQAICATSDTSEQSQQRLLVAPFRVHGQIRPHRIYIYFHSKHCICQNEVVVIAFDIYYFC